MPKHSMGRALEKAMLERRQAEERIEALTGEMAVKAGRALIEAVGVERVEEIADALTKRAGKTDKDELAEGLLGVLKPARAARPQASQEPVKEAASQADAA